MRKPARGRIDAQPNSVGTTIVDARSLPVAI
jgi:hypothetical protein